MPKRKTTKEFIEEAKMVHGNKYDYSKVVYVNNNTKVEIICPEHGSFFQRPNDHLKKNGCPKERYNNVKGKIYGKGINDLNYPNPQEAFEAYKKNKEEYIKEIANKYYKEGAVSEKVYNALMNYEVDIDD